jgi:hypothetical protein
VNTITGLSFSIELFDGELTDSNVLACELESA